MRALSLLLWLLLGQSRAEAPSCPHAPPRPGEACAPVAGVCGYIDAQGELLCTCRASRWACERMPRPPR